MASTAAIQASCSLLIRPQDRCSSTVDEHRASRQRSRSTKTRRSLKTLRVFASQEQAKKAKDCHLDSTQASTGKTKMKDGLEEQQVRRNQNSSPMRSGKIYQARKSLICSTILPIPILTTSSQEYAGSGHGGNQGSVSEIVEGVPS